MELKAPGVRCHFNMLPVIHRTQKEEPVEAMIAIPYSLALQWFIYGVIEYVIYGILLALVFGKKQAPAV
jgi:amino acid permease